MVPLITSRQKKEGKEDDQSMISQPSRTADNEFKMDAKERSKERKKTVENKIDKKSQAMDALKARREDRKARLEEKEKLRYEEEQKRQETVPEDDIDLANLKDDASTVSGVDKSRKKLKASDIYSDDSDGSSSDSESKVGVSNRRKSDSESKSSDSEDERFVALMLWALFMNFSLLMTNCMLD